MPRACDHVRGCYTGAWEQQIIHSMLCIVNLAEWWNERLFVITKRGAKILDGPLVEIGTQLGS